MKIWSSTILILVFHVLTCSAQSFNVAVHDTTKQDLPGEEIIIGGHIINLTTRPLEIEIIRQTNDIPATWSSSLCLAICAAPWVDNITGTVPADDSLEFSIHFFTDFMPGIGRALLVFREPHGSEMNSHLFTAITSGSSIDSKTPQGPHSFKLLGNYPNPFNNSTVICFISDKQIMRANFQVYATNGQLVFQKDLENLPAGENQIYYRGLDYNGYGLPSGIYMYCLLLITNNGNHFKDAKKFTIIK